MALVLVIYNRYLNILQIIVLIHKSMLKNMRERYTIMVTMLLTLLMSFRGYKMPNINGLLYTSISDHLLLGALFLKYINLANKEVTPIEKTFSG